MCGQLLHKEITRTHGQIYNIFLEPIKNLKMDKWTQI